MSTDRSVPAPATPWAMALARRRVVCGGKGNKGLKEPQLGDPQPRSPSLHLTRGPTKAPVPRFPGPQQALPGRGGAPGAGERGMGGAAGAVEQELLRSLPSPPSSPCSGITKGPLPIRFLFNHVSPLSIKAIFKVNYLLPSTANPTQLQRHQPQHHIMK